MARWDATMWPADPGDIAARVDEIVDRVRQNLHAAADDVWVSSAVQAAIGYVIVHNGLIDTGLPADELTVNGLVVFSTRIYLDGTSPGGVSNAYTDPTFQPVYQPENLYAHVHHFFDHLAVSWGVA